MYGAQSSSPAVSPTQAGIQSGACRTHCSLPTFWIPAWAGMTAILLFQLRARNRQHSQKYKRTDQAEREAVGERRVEPASHRHGLPAADQRTQGRAKRWPVRALSSNPLPRQLSLVTFFFARKESYPPAGYRMHTSATRELGFAQNVGFCLQGERACSMKNWPGILVMRG